jgi:hypothetical protein
MDESYTPNLFTVSLGNRFNDYKVIINLILNYTNIIIGINKS